MSNIGIKVVGGLHDGAVVGFTEGVALRLGSGTDVDVLIVDSEVAELQCALFWTGSDALVLEAVDDGLAVEQTAITAGQRLELPVGAVLKLSSIGLHVVRLGADPGPDGVLQALTTTETECAKARCRVLRQLGWRPYLQEVLRQRRAACWVIGSTAFAAVAAIGLFQASISTPTPEQLRAEAAQRLRRLFPDVTITSTSPDGAIRYAGFVRDQRELDQLRTIALGVDPARTIVSVVPMDVLQSNASMWLEDYYDDADVAPSGPGTLRVTVGSEAAVRTLAGWDFEQIGQQLVQALPELLSVRIRLAERSGREIIVPAARMGLSFLPGSAGSVHVIDAGGAAIFSGAQTSDGQVENITPCGLVLRSQSTGSVFRVASGNIDCSSKDIAPETIGE